MCRTPPWKHARVVILCWPLSPYYAKKTQPYDHNKTTQKPQYSLPLELPCHPCNCQRGARILNYHNRGGTKVAGKMENHHQRTWGVKKYAGATFISQHLIAIQSKTRPYHYRSEHYSLEDPSGVHTVYYKPWKPPKLLLRFQRNRKVLKCAWICASFLFFILLIVLQTINHFSCSSNKFWSWYAIIYKSHSQATAFHASTS